MCVLSTKRDEWVKLIVFSFFRTNKQKKRIINEQPPELADHSEHNLRIRQKQIHLKIELKDIFVNEYSWFEGAKQQKDSDFRESYR